MNNKKAKHAAKETVSNEEKMSAAVDVMFDSMEAQLETFSTSKLNDGKYIIGHTIQNKKNSVNITIHKLQEQLELVTKERDELHQKEYISDNKITVLHKSLTDRDLELLSIQNELKSVIKLYEIKVLKYESEIKEYIACFTNANKCIDSLCGVSKKYIRSPNSDKLINDNTNYIKSHELHLIPQKCYLVAARYLFKVLRTIRTQKMSYFLRKWHNIATTETIRMNIENRLAKEYNDKLSMSRADIIKQHNDELTALHTKHNDEVCELKKKINRLSVSRENVSNVLYSYTNENITKPNINHNITIRNVKFNYLSKFYYNWVQLYTKRVLMRNIEYQQKIVSLENENCALKEMVSGKDVEINQNQIQYLCQMKTQFLKSFVLIRDKAHRSELLSFGFHKWLQQARMVRYVELEDKYAVLLCNFNEYKHKHDLLTIEMTGSLHYKQRYEHSLLICDALEESMDVSYHLITCDACLAYAYMHNYILI